MVKENHLFLSFYFNRILFNLDHEVLRFGGSVDQLGLEPAQLLLHDSDLRRGELQFVQSGNVALFLLQQFALFLSPQHTKRGQQLQIRSARMLNRTSTRQRPC